MSEPYNPIIKFLADKWSEAFKTAPLLTTFLSTITLIFFFMVFFFGNKIYLENKKKFRLENPVYKNQIQQLNQVEDGIKKLLVFIDFQKEKIEESEETIALLKKQQTTLETIIQGGEEAVEAIFQIQEERSKKTIWRERIIGFIFGILGSLTASFIWFIVTSSGNKKSPPESNKIRTR